MATATAIQVDFVNSATGKMLHRREQERKPRVGDHVSFDGGTMIVSKVTQYGEAFRAELDMLME